MRRRSLHSAGGTLLQPHNVWIVVGGSRSRTSALAYRRGGPWIPPALDFRMAVHERESSCTVMIAGRHISIESCQGRLVRETGHIDIEIPNIDHILPLIPEQQGAARPWIV